MRRLFLLFLLSALPCFAAYDPRLIHVLEQLRDCRLSLGEELPMVGGAAVGAAGTPHEFYLLLPYVLQVAGDADLKAMVRDRSPVVRIMAAACILKKADRSLRAELEPLAKDRAVVFVAPFGCAILKETVAEVVGEMRKHPRYFEGEEESNPASAPASEGRQR
jgi:hypothetical protein